MPVPQPRTHQRRPTTYYADLGYAAAEWYYAQQKKIKKPDNPTRLPECYVYSQLADPTSNQIGVGMNGCRSSGDLQESHLDRTGSCTVNHNALNPDDTRLSIDRVVG